jgi:hypothetical protein
MPITVFIEVAIGLVLVWLFLALAVMAVQEWIAALDRTRAKGLQQAIREMLEENAQKSTPRLRRSIREMLNSLDLSSAHQVGKKVLEQLEDAGAQLDWKLERTIRRALKGKKSEDEIEAFLESIRRNSLTYSLYAHPLVQSLMMAPGAIRRFVEWLGRVFRGKLAPLEGRMPSYIPDHTFALALLDIVATAGTDKSVIQAALTHANRQIDASIESLRNNGTLHEEVKREAEQAASKLRVILSQIKSELRKNEAYSRLALKVRARLDEIKDAAEQYPQLQPLLDQLGPVMRELTRYAATPPIIQSVTALAARNPKLVNVLSTLRMGATDLVEEAEGKLADYRSSVESWFNDVMDRLVGKYKRRSQLWAFIFGVLIAVLVNVDSVTIITELYREPTLRAALVERAEQLDELPANAPLEIPELQYLREQRDKLQADLEGLGLPVGWLYLKGTNRLCVEREETENSLVIPLGKVEKDTTVYYRCLVAAGAVRGIPRGPEGADPGQGSSPDAAQGADTSAGEAQASESEQRSPWDEWAIPWMSKAGGWLLSGALAAQGAPFWFDILKKLVNIRSAGKNPTEEQEKQKKNA